MLSSAQRSTRARIAAHTLHAKGLTNTAPARAKATQSLNEKLLHSIDPDNLLPDAERAKRLEHARKAYFGRLALKRSK